jgi:dihydrolipoamide dehydrogenase
MTSTEALEIADIPAKLLVVGGGYIGMELGTVYASMGSEVTVVEAAEAILAGADPDLTRPVAAYAKKAFKEVRLKAKVLEMKTAGKQIKVTIEFNGQKLEEYFDRVLVSVGRVPNGGDLGLENTLVQRDERGFIKVDERLATTDPKIYAIGDIAGGIMLAHKASKEARIAVDNIAGESGAVNRDYLIPAVVFTDPEVAWVGLTETEAKAKGITVQVAKFPWGASGRALTYDRTDGFTKLIIDPETERVLGVGIVGHGAGELIGEGAVAIEMGATVHDLANIVHPHPTLSETVMESAEVFFGHATHVFSKKKAH